MLDFFKSFRGASATRPALSEDMTCAECQALRELLQITQSEAAQWIGKVSLRSWQYWEAGNRPVPADVASLLRSIAAERNEVIEYAVANKDKIAKVQIWYAEDDWKWRLRPEDKPWARKLHHSVTSHLASLKLIRIVKFDSGAFVQWCKINAPKPVRDEANLHLMWANTLVSQQVGAAS